MKVLLETLKCPIDYVHSFIYQFHPQKFLGRIVFRNGDIIGLQVHAILHRWTFFFVVMWGTRSIRKIHNRFPNSKNEINRIIGDIEFQLCQNIIQSFIKRLNIFKAARGGYLADIFSHKCHNLNFDYHKKGCKMNAKYEFHLFFKNTCNLEHPSFN